MYDNLDKAGQFFITFVKVNFLKFELLSLGCALPMSGDYLLMFSETLKRKTYYALYLNFIRSLVNILWLGVTTLYKEETMNNNLLSNGKYAYPS